MKSVTSFRRLFPRRLASSRYPLRYQWRRPISIRCTRAPAPAIASASNWDGFYVGANVGGACASDTVTQFNLAGPFPNTGKINSSGIVGGGQFGYNWVGAPNWLLGVEADVYTCISTSATSPSVSSHPTASSVGPTRVGSPSIRCAWV
jgi:hypothetical protein